VLAASQRANIVDSHFEPLEQKIQTYQRISNYVMTTASSHLNTQKTPLYSDLKRIETQLIWGNLMHVDANLISPERDSACITQCTTTLDQLISMVSNPRLQGSAYRLLGKCLVSMGDVPNALLAYKKSMALDPDACGIVEVRHRGASHLY
jgi:tetratricopeptide (TPR) repeat protein